MPDASLARDMFRDFDELSRVVTRRGFLFYQHLLQKISILDSVSGIQYLESGFKPSNIKSSNFPILKVPSQSIHLEAISKIVDHVKRQGVNQEKSAVRRRRMSNKGGSQHSHLALDASLR